MNSQTKTSAAILIACAMRVAAQEVPHTAHNTSAVAPPEPPPRVDRHTITVRDSSGRSTVSWTVEQRPSADEFRRQVTESMRLKQTVQDHDATKTIVTTIPGEHTTRRTVSASEEAYGRLYDPLDPLLINPLEAALVIWDTPDGKMPALFDPAEHQRLLEPWNPDHGFGDGRAD